MGFTENLSNRSWIQNGLKTPLWIAQCYQNSKVNSHFVSNQEKSNIIEKLWQLWNENQIEFVAIENNKDNNEHSRERLRLLNQEMNEIEGILQLLESSEVHVHLEDIALS